MECFRGDADGLLGCITCECNGVASGGCSKHAALQEIDAPGGELGGAGQGAVEEKYLSRVGVAPRTIMSENRSRTCERVRNKTGRKKVAAHAVADHEFCKAQEPKLGGVEGVVHLKA